MEKAANIFIISVSFIIAVQIEESMVELIGDRFEAPTLELWCARDELMLKLNSEALVQARQAVSKGKQYSYGSENEGYFQHQHLMWELEGTYRCGNWLASISMSAAVVETFLSSYLSKGNKSEQFLKSIAFPNMPDYKELVDMRNSIMHLRNRSFSKSAYNKSEKEYFDMATRFLWLTYFLKDYVLFFFLSDDS
ncbi:hypothetical protein ACUSRQ_005128 [Vibrio harveyi]|nr:hypothetical protein [Vibrio harveyi]